MAEELHPAVLENLDQLSLLDPGAALDAGVALSWLVGGHGVDRLHQAGLQQFLWYELPFKWLGPVEGRHALVAALARFFDVAGLPRYASVCRSSTTATVLDQWADDPESGYVAFHAAHLASGVVPPDLDGFAWGDLMGDVELAAFWSTAQALELAVEGGALAPGRRGWKHDQQDLARRHVSQPRPEEFGESLHQAVMTERLASWAERGPSEARRAILGPVTNLLLHDVAPPAGASRSVRPLVWLTLALERPARAAAAGGLPPRFVRDAADRFHWGGVPGRAVERDLPPLAATRDLAMALRLVRRRDGSFAATPHGTELASAPRTLWTAAATAIGEQSGFAGGLSELLDASLLAGERPRRPGLEAMLRVPLTEEGWHGGHAGQPTPTGLLAPELDRQLAIRVALGALARRGASASEPLRLTAGGRLLALASLRARAVRPRVALPGG
ncbi:MAG: hypothetical protein HYX32_12665 [Actinobacteria bacterium]|nr:hypothetical protein [Actinomycetota bacterium]